MFTHDYLLGLAHLDFAAVHTAVVGLQGATARFDSAVRSLRPPPSAARDHQALIRANQLEAADVARAAAASRLTGVVTAIGHWAADGGPELALAIRLRQELPPSAATAAG